jgi:macrolide transport system ATP-binding/permease protein
MESLLNDIRYGARILWKTKGLTAVAVASLAVGIGTNSAIFSLVNALLLRPRAVAEPEQLTQLYVGDRQQRYQTTSYPSYLDLRQRNQVFSGLASYGLGWQFNLGGPNEVQQVWGEVVSGNYFDVLGVRAFRGRTFLPEEDQVPNRNPVVVISHGLWQRRFNSDPGIIGKAITINNQPLTVVGIAPPQYTGMVTGWAAEIWVPAMIVPLLDPSRGERVVTSRGNRWLTLIGRLKPGTTLEQARSHFAVLTKEMQAAHPEEWLDRREDNSVRESFVSVLSESETRVHPQMRAPVYALAVLLFVIVDLVLVMACMNLASLFFARAVARRNEIALRLALGAGRTRILRQLLIESVLVSLVAGAIGALLAFGGLGALVAYMPALPEGIRLAVDVHPDARVLAYTIVFSILTGLLFGLAPALHAARGAVLTVLKDDTNVTARFRRSRARMSLIVAQVAASLLLLLGAGLVLRSLEKVRPTRLGFATANYVAAPLALDESRYDRSKSHLFYERLAASMAALPGVRSVSLVDAVPGGFLSRSRSSTGIEGYTPSAGESTEIDATVVGPRYFTNLRVPVVAGRDFDERDRAGAPCVTMVNEAFAQRYFGGTARALGRHLIQGEDPSSLKMCEIVGIFRDNDWQSLNREVRPFWARPLLQSDENRMTLLVEVATDPASLLPAVRQAIQKLDPNIPVTDVRTLGSYFNGMSYPFRLFGLVIAGCGVMALLLAVIGIYGTIAYSVVQRRREVGIRMALGALHADILKLVVGQGMRLVVYGTVIGLLLGLALTRVLTNLPLGTELLFGVSATDSITFAGVTLLLALVALAACYVPALRATKVDPMVTLRNS